MGERTPAVYILANQTRVTIYTGVTSDPPVRWRQHREEQLRGFTSLVHVEFPEDMERAIFARSSRSAGIGRGRST